jgi:hypothetical protein
MTKQPEQLATWLSRLGGRKFLVAMLVEVVNAALVAFKLIGSEAYATVAVAVVSAYVASNAYLAVRKP